MSYAPEDLPCVNHASMTFTTHAPVPAGGLMAQYTAAGRNIGRIHQEGRAGPPILINKSGGGIRLSGITMGGSSFVL